MRMREEKIISYRFLTFRRRKDRKGNCRKLKKKNEKKKKFPPAPPIRKKKRVKEETTDHYNAHARGKNICICQIFINFAEPQGCQGALELSHGNSGRRPALVAILCPLSFFLKKKVLEFVEFLLSLQSVGRVSCIARPQNIPLPPVGATYSTVE